MGLLPTPGYSEPPPPARPKRDAVEKLFAEHPDWEDKTIARPAKTSRAYVGSILFEIRARKMCADLRNEIAPSDIVHIANEAENYLDTLQGRVNEGKCIDAASEFARWLQFSGISELCAKMADNPRVRSKCKELLTDVNWRYERNNTAPKLEKIQFESLSEKIDRLEKLITAKAA